VRASTAGVELALGQRHRVPMPLASITLLQSVPRGDRMDIIVQKTTELGVTRIVPVLSSRGMVKPPPGKTVAGGPSPRKRPASQDARTCLKWPR